MTLPEIRPGFWERTDRSGGPDACWLWMGPRDPKGYARLGWGYRDYRLGRVILAALHGRPLGAHEQACHHCDNPPCVNPAHLFVGTKADNMRDMCAKGRAPAILRKRDVCARGHVMAETRVVRTNGSRCGRCEAMKKALSHRRVYWRERLGLPEGAPVVLPPPRGTVGAAPTARARVTKPGS